MGGFFYTLFYQPLFNALIFLYQNVAFQDLGIAIVLLTIVIRVILYPLFYKSYKNQTLLQRLQPEIKRIQALHKENKEKQAKELLALYKEHKVNPFSGFLLILIQLPILIALYRVFLNGFSEPALSGLYSFISVPETINHIFLGLIDLSKPNIIIVGLSAMAQYFQGRLTIRKPKQGQELSQAEKISRQMMFMSPVLTLIILYSLPAATGLYWLTTSLFSVFQQVVINYSIDKNGKIAESDKINT